MERNYIIIQIAARLHCSFSSIEQLFAMAKNSDEIPSRMKCSGAPKKVTKEIENITKKAYEKNPKLTSQEIVRGNKKLSNWGSYLVGVQFILGFRFDSGLRFSYIVRS